MIEKKIFVMQIISVLVVLVFVVLSAFDCVVITKEGYGHSSMNPIDSENIPETTVSESKENNQFYKVAAIGVIEVVLLIVGCFKLGILASVVECLLTSGLFLAGAIEEMFQTIATDVPRYIITSKITEIGCLVTIFAVLNLVFTIILQVKKKALVKGGCEYATSSYSDGV